MGKAHPIALNPLGRDPARDVRSRAVDVAFAWSFRSAIHALYWGYVGIMEATMETTLSLGSGVLCDLGVGIWVGLKEGILDEIRVLPST